MFLDLPTVCYFISYRFDMSVEEAAELARRAIYHATFRDGASGGVVSGMCFSIAHPLFLYTVKLE